MAKKRAEMVTKVLEIHTETDVIMKAMAQTQRILDAKYEKADIQEYVTQQTSLSAEEKPKLKSLLFKCKILFNGILGKFNGAKASFKLKPSENCIT